VKCSGVSNWEGAFRVPCFIKWPGNFPAGTTLNGIVSHEDWLSTFAAVAGAPDIKEKLLKGGVELNGRAYKNHVDGYNMLDYLSGKAKESPRNEFIYLNDAADIAIESRLPVQEVPYDVLQKRLLEDGQRLNL
jgi:arylsulfatase